ncbi:hypothetical protein QFC19_008714 [Naganishia cerealis]|uniref:Uncharacterized protein n=1 Tax=Naganishia cerealis TaxID=610337 RepID=A0ACC2V1E9_9TREE|nr:hypothetical protein QFC19_008714 [Naganishia cerealis]
MMRHIQRRIGPSLSSLPSNRTLCARLHAVFIVPFQQPVLYTRSFSSRHNGFRPSIGPSVSIPALIATDCRATPSPVSKPGCPGSGDRKRNYAQEALRGQEEENQSEPTPVRTFERYLPKTYAPRIPITKSRTVNESEIAELQRSKGKVPEAEGKESREDGAVDKKARWKTSGQSARKPPAKQGTAKDARLQITKPSFPSRKNIPENVKSNVNGSSVHLQDSIISKTDNRSVSGEGVLPDAVDHDDSTEVEIFPFHSLGKEQLSKGPALTLSASEDAYLDATSDFNFADDFVEIDQEDLMRHLQGVEEYAPAQNEAIKQGIKDVGGRPAWGTKGNPLKGDLDPLEVDMMGIDKLAGGEEQSSFFMDIELEEARYAVREGSERIPGIKQPPHDLAEMNDDVDSLRTPPKKTRFRSRPAKAEGGQVPQKELSISQTRLQAVKSMLRSISAEEDDARYGMDGDGNPSYSRFQWWRRATSRHAASFYDAKKVTVQRKALPIHKLSSKDYWYKPLERYTENFIPLIEAEQAHEEKVIRERLDTMAVEKLATEGYCLTDLSARPDKASQAGRPTYTFAFAGRGGSRRFAWNRFNPGTSVIISPAGEKAKPVKRDQSKGGKGSTAYNTGSVVSKTFGSVKVSFDEPLNEAELSNTWRLDIWTSDIVLRRAKEALSTLHYNPVAIDRHGVPQPEVVSTTETGEVTELAKPSIPITQQILPGTALRRVLLDDFIPPDAPFSKPAHLNGPGFFADNELIQSWCRRQLVDRREPIEVEGDPDIALNTSQKRAIATMLSSNISLIQGPPGTGKTRTIIEMLRLLKVHWEVPQAILVSAYTNAACDNLAEGMSKRGLKVLRYGSKSRIREDLHELTLDQHLDRHPDKNRLHWLKDQTFKLSKGR